MCYKFTLEILGYSNWFNLILKIGKLQGKNNIWLNNDILQLVNPEYFKIMLYYGIVDEAFIDNNKFISLTDLGLSIFNNKMIEVWIGMEYRLEEKDNVFIDYNDNPNIVLDNLINNQLICKENLLEFKFKP